MTDATATQDLISPEKLTHLARLEAESIHIMREVVAQFERPVMMYSIGKDSSVMLHLARKAFHPGTLPFPLLHIDTTWKFSDMITFRDNTAEELGLDLIVHTNQEGKASGINPFDHGSKNYTDVMKTQALKQGPVGGTLRRGLRWRTPRRREVAGEGTGLQLPGRQPPLGPEEPASRVVEHLQRPGEQG